MTIGYTLKKKKVKLTLGKGEKTKSEWTREINTGLWREDRTLIEGSGAFIGLWFVDNKIRRLGMVS